MSKIKEIASLIAHNKGFELFITGIIILNSVLIGVETYTDNLTVKMIQYDNSCNEQFESFIMRN